MKSSGDDYRKAARARRAAYVVRLKKRGFKAVMFWLKASEVAPMRAHLAMLRASKAKGSVKTK